MNDRNGPSAPMRDLAQRLLEVTRSGARTSGSGEDPRAHGALDCCERLRVALSRFAGADGFASLLRRALTLARTDVPALKRVQIGANGRIEGLDAAVPEGEEAEAAVALTAHLLDLLVSFIGEPLTLRLVRDGWPELEAGPRDTSEW